MWSDGQELYTQPDVGLIKDPTRLRVRARSTAVITGEYHEIRTSKGNPYEYRDLFAACGVSKGDLRAEVKRVVWHEVAHWLGYETEEQVKALGL
jgi:hypothetical protein